MALNFDLGSMLSPDYQDPTAIVPLGGTCNPTGNEPAAGACIILGSKPTDGECNPTGCEPDSQVCIIGINRCEVIGA